MKGCRSWWWALGLNWELCGSWWWAVVRVPPSTLPPDEKTSANCSQCHQPAQLGQELAKLQDELEAVRLSLTAQETLLDNTSRAHHLLASSGQELGAQLAGCWAATGQLNRTLGQLWARVGGWREEAEGLRGSLRALMEERLEAMAAIQRLNASLGQSWGRLRNAERRVEEEKEAMEELEAGWHNHSRLLGGLRAAAAETGEAVKGLRGRLGAAGRRAGETAEGMHELVLQVMGLQLQLDNISSSLDEQRENLGDLHYHSRYGQKMAAERFQELEGRLEGQRLELATMAANVNATDGHVHAMLRYLDDVRLSCTLGFHAQAEELEHLNASLGRALGEAEGLREGFGFLRARLDFEVRNLSALLEEMKGVDAKHGEALRDVAVLRGEGGRRNFGSPPIPAAAIRVTLNIQHGTQISSPWARRCLGVGAAWTPQLSPFGGSPR